MSSGDWSAWLDELRRQLVPQLHGLVSQAEHRTYWIFLLSAGLLALGVSFFGARHVAWREGLRRWGSPSARVDYLLILVKPIIFAVFALPWALTAHRVGTSVVRALDGWMGPPGWTFQESWWIAALYTVVLFVTWDASRFVLHLAMHRIPALWAFHQVHHSAQVLTPWTLYRIHPVESALYHLRGILVTGLVTGLFFWAFRGAASEVELFGINALGAAFSLAGGNLRHSHVWWGWGPLERWFISPAQHQIHHGQDTDRLNYGTWLSIWDRMAGSFAPSAGVQPPTFGLRAEDRNHAPDSFVSALLDPIWALGARVAAAAGLGSGAREET